MGEAEGSCCGDGVCSSDEDSCRCALDCGGGPPVEAVCEDGADNDCDGLVDCEDPDCCGETACDDGIDVDNDGVASCDCNDNDALVWGVPDEALGLELSHSPASGTLISWKPPAFPGAAILRYDVIRSDSGSDFAFGVSCLVSDDPSTSLSEFEDPPSGTAFHYLVRAENDCPEGNGSLGQSSDDEPRAGRDCP